MSRRHLRAFRALSGVAAVALVASGISLVGISSASAVVPSVTVTGNDIRPNESSYVGWHEGYNNLERAYNVAADGLHFGNGNVHSQILNGTAPEAATSAQLETRITTAAVAITSGPVTFQIPLFFGPGQTQNYTTLRPAISASSFSAGDDWTSSKDIPNTGTVVVPKNTPTPLSDIIAALDAQGSLRLLGFGVQSDNDAIVTSITYNGTEYVFAPHVAEAPTTQVTVHDIDLLGVEQDNPGAPGFNYESWHEGKSVDSSTVKSDGLNLGTPGASTVIHGTTVKTTPNANVVTQAQLQALITNASFTVTSGSTNFQVPVNFDSGLSNFTTIMSENFTAGTHTFSLNDTWRTSRAFGPYTAFQQVKLGDLLDTLFSSSVSGGEVWVAGFGAQADSLAVIPTLVWAGTEYTFHQPVVDTVVCTPTAGPVATNQSSEGWTFGETRTQGHNVFVASGLHVYTDSNTSQDKAAGYKAVNIPLSSVGAEPALNMSNTSGGLPSLQLGISLDGDGVSDGYLVNEGDIYGHGNWWTNKTTFGVSPGGGYPSLGTINDYLLANPDATVVSIGYSLGSGLLGNAIVNSIIVGCVEYGFGLDTAHDAAANTVNVDDSQIAPFEDSNDASPTFNYNTWHEGYNNAARAYSTQADGLHLGDGLHSQVMTGLGTPLATSELESLITSASLSVGSGSVTFQIPITYGDHDTFTTLRTTSMTAGADQRFAVTDSWVSTRPLVDNDDGAVTSSNATMPLADLAAFITAQGNVKVLGVGVQADSSAVAQDLLFNGTKYHFVPTGAIAATNHVVVPDTDIALNETPANYTTWHEGYANASTSFSVDLNGLKLGDPSHSQILKGLDTAVAGGDLYSLLTSQAGVTVVSGTVTYQMAFTFGASGWGTLRSASLGAGEHTFTLSDPWMSSKPIGASIASNTAYPLGDILDAMNAEGNAAGTAFGVQADSAAQVSSITWGTTEYSFVPSIAAFAPTITGTAKVGETLTATPNEGSWTPSSGLTFSYQWKANGSAISGATASTYLLTAAELDKTIAVTVTGAMVGYADASATSLGTDEVINDHIVVTRIAGANRYATAVAISQKWADGSGGRVYIANGLGYPDALSAGPAAGHFNAPLLLTAPDSLPAVLVTELNRLEPSEIIIVGGTGVVSAAVETALNDLAFHPTVRRVAGANRYETSRAIAADTFAASSVAKAYLANGTNFPDALSASPVAAHFDGPVILVPGSATSVDSATLGLLATLGVVDVKLAGETGALSADIEAQLIVAYGAPHVQRNGGANRYGTSVAINMDEFTTARTVYLATGTGFPDALAGAAIAGAEGAPLFISQTHCVPQAIMDAINNLGATRVILLGGTGVLDSAVENLTTCAP